ncbi:YihY/virulence factor BrkB family protein [Halocatena marina]|uniref:YihY/virulence factor BrkB family protein n=1 Tax=Halocatena marina TaxID=2934937 RepID=UPI0036217AA7
MNASVQRIISVIQTVIDGIRSEQVTFIAASLSYYAFISLIPLLLLTIVVGSVVGGEMFSTAVSEPVTNAVGGQAGELVQNALDNQSGQSGATVVSILVLLWSGLKLFRGLDVAFSTVYGEPPSDGIVGQLRNGLLTLMAVGIGIALTVAIGTIIAFPGSISSSGPSTSSGQSGQSPSCVDLPSLSFPCIMSSQENRSQSERRSWCSFYSNRLDRTPDSVSNLRCLRG